MAFPIPSHLPRKKDHDVSSAILSKLDDTTAKSLNASVAASWLTELDTSIQSIKDQIHERIHADLPYFDQQLTSSRSVQTRMQALTSNVEYLSDALSNPHTGLIPTLIGSLTTHASLVQEVSDSRAKHFALSSLLECKNEFHSLSSLVSAGQLPDAVAASERLGKHIGEAPLYLKQTRVMSDLKRKFRALRDRTEEQLSDAYARSVVVSATELIIRSSVQIRESATVLPLSSILSSLSPESMSSHLASLRRDLIAYKVDNILQQPTYVTVHSTDTVVIQEHKLSHFPSPPNSEVRTARLDNLSAILDFLSTHLFSALPAAVADSFRRSLCKPVTTAVLDHLLITSLPSSFALLPFFLELVQAAVEFEDKYIIGVLGNDKNDSPIRGWAHGVSGHYERKRRLDILASARALILEPANPSDVFSVDVEVAAEAVVIPVQEDASPSDLAQLKDLEPDTNSSVEEDGWGFDDDIEAEAEPVVEASPTATGADEPDPEDAWGWKDDEDSAIIDEETAWDDPWSDEPSSNSSDLRSSSPLSPPPGKPATRLEKFSSKHKKTSTEESPFTSPQPSELLAVVSPVLATSPVKKPPKLTSANLLREAYVVSGRMKEVIRIVENVLREGSEFASSVLITTAFASPNPESKSGLLLLQVAPSVLDLFRALYPVKFSTDLALSPEKSMRFSNDCLYLSGAATTLVKMVEEHNPVVERLKDSASRLQVLGESWYDDTIRTQQKLLDDILEDGTQGFTDTGDQARYDECESAVNRVLQEVRRAAQRWKGILTKSKYYAAIGLVANAVLSRVLADILALPDIPEVESHRLSELCRILNALEGLFVEDTSQASFVVAYVPSWLKFSYLSELLEASMADITYLFEEGALVDFDVDELATLVRALFADTALRASTINKLLTGHPVSQ